MRVLVIAAFLVTMAMPVVLAGPAHAHATLVSSEPAEGAVIPAPPPRLILTFNEPVSPLALRLVAPDKLIYSGAGDGETQTSLAIALPSELHNGTHVLSWHVVSLDGHPIGGTVVFSIGAPSVGPTNLRRKAQRNRPSLPLYGRSKSSSTWGCSPELAELLSCLACQGCSRQRANGDQDLLAGGSCRNAGAGRSTGCGCAGVAAIGTGRQDVSGRRYFHFIRSNSDRRCLCTPHRSCCTSNARRPRAFAVRYRNSRSRVGAERSCQLRPLQQWLTPPAVFVHVISVSIWIGALVPLGAAILGEPAPRGRPRTVLARDTLGRRYAASWPAQFAVVQVAEPGALLTTAYGVILSAKLCLVATLLAIAAWNRFLSDERGDRRIHKAAPHAGAFDRG